MIDCTTARELALALPEAEERDHRGHPSFRVKSKIFATLWPDEQRAVLKLALADQTVSFAAVSWACAHGHATALHLVHAVFLVAIAASTIMASQLWATTRSHGEGSETLAQRHFLAGLAVASGLRPPGLGVSQTHQQPTDHLLTSVAPDY